VIRDSVALHPTLWQIIPSSNIREYTRQRVGGSLCACVYAFLGACVWTVCLGACVWVRVSWCVCLGACVWVRASGCVCLCVLLCVSVHNE